MKVTTKALATLFGIIFLPFLLLLSFALNLDEEETEDEFVDFDLLYGILEGIEKGDKTK